MTDHTFKYPQAPTPFLRRLAEASLGPLILKRHLPAEAGGAVLFASGAVGGMRYLFKRARQWDPELLLIASRLVKKGATVWDVGANVGLFSRAAAFHAGPDGIVVSIEADVDAVALLNRTCRHRAHNHAKNIVVPAAVSDQCGFVQFDIAKRARSSNAIMGFGSTQMGAITESRTLPCITLDSMLPHFRAPDVLKIDVEGAEVNVLKGSARTIESVRPAIYCEIQGDTWRETSDLLEARNYRLWDGSRFDDRSASAGVSAETCNLVAIPEEKVHLYMRAHD